MPLGRGVAQGITKFIPRESIRSFGKSQPAGNAEPTTGRKNGFAEEMQTHEKTRSRIRENSGR
jgi:hypothetical protein